MEIRVNRIGRVRRLGSGGNEGGAGGNPPPSGGAITVIRTEQLSPILGTAMEVVTVNPHMISLPFTVTISGNSEVTYNGTFVVEVVKSANVFAITVADVGNGTGGTWVRA